MSTHAPAGTAQHVAETVTAAARGLFPHTGLSDRVYGRVAAKLTEGAAGDADAERVLNEGVAQLDAGGAGGVQFVELDDDARLAALRAIEGSAFFELVRSTAVVEVYNDPETWELLGYEGPSFDKGGYLHRGFNDLDWLDEPEEPALGGYAYFADEEFLPDPHDRDEDA
jgi:hypothetical protein